MSISNTSGVNSLMGNYYGQTRNSDGSWNNGHVNNQDAIDVDGYVPPKSPSRNMRVSSSGGSAAGVVTPTEQAQQTDVTRGASSALKTTAQVLSEQDQSNRDAKKAVAAGNFLVDVINANNAYQNTVGQAQINIMLAHNSEADALYRGHQAALDRQSEGVRAGEDATLAMAAQGQDVNGRAVGKIVGSYRAMGYENAAREEINSIREAMGYELEQVNYDYQEEMAGINRDVAITGSAINTGVMLAAL